MTDDITVPRALSGSGIVSGGAPAADGDLPGDRRRHAGNRLAAQHARQRADAVERRAADRQVLALPATWRARIVEEIRQLATVRAARRATLPESSAEIVHLDELIDQRRSLLQNSHFMTDTAGTRNGRA